MTMQQQAEEILSFWFGALDADGFTAEDRRPLWFGSRRQDDEELRARFGARIADAALGKLAAWQTASDETNMALLLLTDQMTRAVYRGSAAAFCGDAVALAVCKNGVADGRHQRLPPAWRPFYYLPLEHSERLDDQALCVSLFESLLREFSALPARAKELKEAARYAQIHYDIIKQFGRFPHRNALLSRANTAAEAEYLADSSAQHFGQKPQTDKPSGG